VRNLKTSILTVLGAEKRRLCPAGAADSSRP
jgi:hypothetical protein